MGGGGGGTVSLAGLGGVGAGGGTGTATGPGLIGSTLGAGGSGAFENSNKLREPPSSGTARTLARRSCRILGSTLLTSISSLTFSVGRKSSIVRELLLLTGACRCGRGITGSAVLAEPVGSGTGLIGGIACEGRVADAATVCVGVSLRFSIQYTAAATTRIPPRSASFFGSAPKPEGRAFIPRPPPRARTRRFSCSRRANSSLVAE